MCGKREDSIKEKDIKIMSLILAMPVVCPHLAYAAGKDGLETTSAAARPGRAADTASKVRRAKLCRGLRRVRLKARQRELTARLCTCWWHNVLECCQWTVSHLLKDAWNHMRLTSRMLPDQSGPGGMRQQQVHQRRRRIDSGHRHRRCPQLQRQWAVKILSPGYRSRDP